MVWAFVLRKPSTAPNRVAALAVFGGIYQEEQTRIRYATVGLTLAVILFLVGIGWFVWTVEPKMAPTPTPVSAPAAGSRATSSG